MCGTEGLSSSAVRRVEEEKHVVEALQRNGYPKRFIQKQTCQCAHRASLQDSDTRATLTIPYISGLFESIRRILSPLSIWVLFRPLKTLKQELVHSLGVRKEGSCLQHSLCWVPCTNIGQTGRSLDMSLQEHRWALKKGDVTVSAVAEHVFEAGHQVDFSKTSVIDYHPTSAAC